MNDELKNTITALAELCADRPDDPAAGRIEKLLTVLYLWLSRKKNLRTEEAPEHDSFRNFDPFFLSAIYASSVKAETVPKKTGNDAELADIIEAVCCAFQFDIQAFGSGTVSAQIEKAANRIKKMGENEIESKNSLILSIQELTRKNDSLKIILDDMNRGKIETEEKIARNENEIKTAESELNLLKENFRIKKNVLNEILNKIRLEKSQLTEDECQIERQTAENEEKKQRNARLQSEMQKQRKKLDENFEKLKKDKDDLEKESKELNIRIADNRKMLDLTKDLQDKQKLYAACLDPAAIQKINEIWQSMPEDVFDKNLNR